MGNGVATATTTNLVATPNPVTAGQALSLTATVRGATVPAGTVSFLSGSTVLGAATLNTSGVATLSTSSLAAGSYTLTAQFTGNNGLLPSTSPAVPVTVNASSAPATPPFTLDTGGSTSSQTVLPGGTAVYALTVKPAAGLTLPAMTFSASGLPVGATATFSPQTIAAGSGTTNVTLSIQSAPLSARLEHNKKFDGGLSVIALGMLLLPFGGVMRRSGKRMMRLSSVLLLLAGALTLAGLSGCAGGISSPNARTYDVKVTTTGDSISQSTTVTLVVE
jgi:hypothetical protein